MKIKRLLEAILAGCSAEFLLEVNSSYGAWIDHTGRFHDIKENQGHKHVLQVYFNDTTLGFNEIYEKAFNLGWIRLVYDGTTLSAEWKNRGASSDAKRALVRELPVFENFFLSAFKTFNNDEIPMNTQEVARAKAFIQSH